ncbi:hypothetical protein L486_04045 [Kwoniella mangroviensis CBS 10435]|uniref:Protein UNC80 C-terminal domain-containing protein n=1 Tax=Kwoniella mangroviensis CBS 10435 TaxID=1331196 RepID=A0A1B9IR48_9TREE|nr:hypothetical protein L486_04045 [Kwoniella mangroviensis CBS 10435]
MADHSSPTSPPSLRQGKRVPSGPRPPPMPLRGSPTSSRVTSAGTNPSLRKQTSFGSLSKFISTPRESPLDSIIDAEHDYTVSPESSPLLKPAGGSSKDLLPIASPETMVSEQRSPPVKGRPHAQTITALPMSRETSKNRAQTMPDGDRPITPTSASFAVSRPVTPTGIKSPPKSKSKPKPSRLNTSNLMTSTTSSPTKLVSPGMKHWQQVRSHVMAPTPAEERSSQHHHVRHPAKKMTGLVSKAAGRFGFKHAADNVIGYNDRRQSIMGILSDLNDLSKEEKEAITRERRKFARDVKVCLDACCLEESKRRLARIGYDNNSKSILATYNAETKSSGITMHNNGSIHTSSHMQKFTFDPEFSAFAPLLMELHKHLPSARSKKPWSRTCPHHSAILAELGTAFLQDSTSTDGERQQALEVFGVIVKNWASDNADEELERWLWLCRALLGNDRQLRNRGLALLNRFLHPDSSLPKGLDRPQSALAFLSLACALIQLLHAVEMSGYGNEDHLQMVNGFLADLSEGDIITLEEMSLVDLLGSLELGGSLGGVDKELVWIAVGMIIGTQPSIAPWLLVEKCQVLQRFYPPPLLHATPPVILNLRSRSFSLFFTSYTSLISASLDVPLATRLWRSARDMLIPEVEHLPDEDGSLAVSLATFLFELELQGHKLQPSKVEQSDPFRIAMEPVKDVKVGVTEHRDMIAEYSTKQEWKSHFELAAKQVISDGPVEAVCRMVQSFLQNKRFLALGKECVIALFARISSSSGPLREARPFLIWLSKSHPQLFYKPLFSCSASTSLSTLLPHLRLVRALSDLLGPARYWTQADPQMVVIVLIGDVGPKQPKGKGKEGEKVTVNVKLGRYAVLVGLIEALGQVDEPAGSGSRLRAFIENVEARLAAFLKAEEKDGSLPEGYKGLICQLLFRMRDTTMSIKKSAWLKSVLAWFTDLAASEPYRNAETKTDDEQLLTLKTLYQGMISNADSQGKSTPIINSLPSKWTGGSARRDSLPILSEKTRAIFDTNLAKIVPFLLVTVHAALSTEDWEALLPKLWHYYDSSRPSRKGLTFLLEKCAERIPGQLRAIMISDLTSDYTFVRSHALSKVAMLFGWRFQVLAQRILTDRRGPVFQFTSKTLDFVATEIGSPNWVPPHDVQDAALKKFGRTLPLELRQRLMELGWSEDESLQAKSDWEQVPVSALPALQYQQEGVNVERSPSPMRSLTRKGSSGSGNSVTGKRRKAVFSPTLLAIINEQARALAGEIDGPISTTSLEIVRLLQRDDPTGLLRPIAEGFGDVFLDSLARLNCIFATLTPGFAYAALNSLVGHLKTVLRNSPHFDHHALALATISRLVPSTSEFSLRDIRKNKAEHVLLPASIHEDEGGFKVHAPWRDGQIDVQTGQLLILTESLRANPREVYLFKKMLSNLQIRDSIPHLPFARAWLVLISTLFSAVNRNYNDRAELRHFLSNVGNILQIHGQKDLLVASHAMRVFMLCSARFRRLFASMGFSTIMRSVYDTYSGGSSALKDCIEYASRSFYRIHQDSFVYQTCVVISEGEHDPSEVYMLLSSLSRGNSESSGVSSGIKDLNNQEEIDALVQMLSGPEIALSDLGQAFSEKHSLKQVSAITLEETIFSKENIIKLFVTVIAANPATRRAANFLRLLSGLVPHISEHPPSQELLREGVEVLGAVIQKGKTGDEAAITAFHPGSNESTSDWTAARREYVFLVESFARSGGQLGASATKRTLDMVLDLLKRQPESVGPAASSIVSSLAKTHLSSSKPTPFLRDIAPLFRMFIAVVDFSGVLDSITALIKRSSFNLDGEITSIIVENYVEPAVRMLASAAEESMAFIVPLRSSAVKLLAAAVFLRGDALGALERQPPSASLLASLVLPLCLLLEPPEEVDREAVYGSLWIRLLAYVLKSRDRHKTKTVKTVTTNQVIAATVLLTVQIVKIIFIRASESISSIKGLWTYISSYLLRVIEDGDASFADSSLINPSPRIVDWIMWSLFELICLHKNPIMIDLRYKLQLVLLNVHEEVERSAPPSPSLGAGGKLSNPPMTSQSMSGRARRISSARTPSASFGHSRLPSATYPDMSGFGLGLDSTPGQGHGHSRTSSTKLTPEYIKNGQHSRMPSQTQQFLTPFSGSTPPTSNRIGSHSRMPSQSSLSGGNHHSQSGGSGNGGMVRPSFSALSARRVSRPAFEVFQNTSGGDTGAGGMHRRFPSSAGDIRNLTNEKIANASSKANGGAIVHLLSTPNQILSATSSNFPTFSPSHSPISPQGKNPLRGNTLSGGGVNGRRGESALREIRVKNDKLCEMTRKSMKMVRLINGYENGNNDGENLFGDDNNEDDDMMRSWNVSDALNVISEQTRIFVEEEFRDLFSPISSTTSHEIGLGDLSTVLDHSLNLTDARKSQEKEKEKRESGYSLAPEGYHLDPNEHYHHHSGPGDIAEEEEEEENLKMFNFGGAFGFNEKRRNSSLTRNNIPLLSVSEN